METEDHHLSYSDECRDSILCGERSRYGPIEITKCWKERRERTPAVTLLDITPLDRCGTGAYGICEVN